MVQDWTCQAKNDDETNENAKNSSFVQRIILGDDDQMEVVGFCLNHMKNSVTWTFYILTLGLLRLLFHWFPQLKLQATHSKCSLEVAEKVLIINTYKEKFKSYFVKDVKITITEPKSKGHKTITESHKRPPLTARLENGEEKELSLVRSIRCKKVTFVWDPEQKVFIRLVGLDYGSWRTDFHQYRGYTEQEQHSKRIVYGANEINVPLQSVFTLFVLEALTPFYIFQVFSIVLWLLEQYFYYGIAIVVMSAFGLSSSIVQTRKNQRNLRGTVASTARATVLRADGGFADVEASLLVPGDVVLIPGEGCEMQCDAVLISGSCTVNESMLTGESVPVNKTALPNDGAVYRVKEDQGHTLFCGTKVIQTKFYDNEKILAVVIRTGYLTSKGELVRSIIYPPPADFKFDQDSYKVIAILTVISIIGMIYTIVAKSFRRLPFLDILIKSLDLVTIAIPPALPAAMTVGKLYALSRLKKSDVYCINSRVINVSGSIDCVCFDKTGTLTEDELDMWGVVEAGSAAPLRDTKLLDVRSPLFRGMLTCHTLTVIDGKVCGYPLDVKMFEATDWTLEVGKGAAGLQGSLRSRDDRRIDILAVFQFSSTLQKQSVVCRDGNDVEIFCKGSPEAIIALCPEGVADATLKQLSRFTGSGYRVIAMAHRRFDGEVSSLRREDVERDLQFAGLIVLENKLKKETAGAIATLKAAKFKTVMITGDNIQTAVSVGRECGIVEADAETLEVIADDGLKFAPFDERSGAVQATDCDLEAARGRRQFVLSGRSWANVVERHSDQIGLIVSQGVVFARMSGLQKQQLIEALKNEGYYVAMCGDGANDCAALRAAHIGVSLSEAEASIAAPFTSRRSDISCVPLVAREGRAALATSFGVFKFMVCGSLTEFFCTVILYGIDCNLSSMQFLFVDLFLQLNFASFFGQAEAAPRLATRAPPSSLLAFAPVVSMTLFSVQTFLFQLVAFYMIRGYDFYRPYVYRPFQGVQEAKCHENFSIFVVCMFQYITMAVIFSKGRPHRQPIYTNSLLMGSIAFALALCIYISTTPADWIVRLLEIQPPPMALVTCKLLALAAANFLLSFVVEDYLIDKVMDNVSFRKFFGRKIKKNSKSLA